MTEHFIRLTCENCGGELDVYDDVERFACGRCGAAMEVQRRGGTVVLRMATGVAQNAQTGTGPASAELALRRLREEAEDLSQQREAMLKQRTERKKLGFAIGAALLVLGFLLVRFGGGFVVGLSLMMAGILTIKFIRGADKRALTDMRELQAKIDVVNGRIEDNPYHSLAPTLPSRDGTN